MSNKRAEKPGWSLGSRSIRPPDESPSAETARKADSKSGRAQPVARRGQIGIPPAAAACENGPANKP